MNVTPASQLSSLAAASGSGEVSLVMLRKALDQSASASAQLLQALPSTPQQREGSGSIVDTYA